MKWFSSLVYRFSLFSYFLSSICTSPDTPCYREAFPSCLIPISLSCPSLIHSLYPHNLVSADMVESGCLRRQLINQKVEDHNVAYYRHTVVQTRCRLGMSTERRTQCFYPLGYFGSWLVLLWFNGSLYLSCYGSSPTVSAWHCLSRQLMGVLRTMIVELIASRNQLPNLSGC